MNKQLAIVLSAVILGALTISYGAKVLIQKNKSNSNVVNQKTQEVNEKNAVQINENKNNKQNNQKNNILPFNIKDVKSPEDLQNLAKKVGPYTCYITETDKNSHKVTKIIISTNGNNKTYLENKSNNEVSKVWIVDNTYYIETGKLNHVDRIKITGDLAKAYSSFINTAMGQGLLSNISTYNSPDSNYKVDVKCQKGKVYIPNFNPKLFKGFSFNIKMQ